MYLAWAMNLLSHGGGGGKKSWKKLVTTVKILPPQTQTASNFAPPIIWEVSAPEWYFKKSIFDQKGGQIQNFENKKNSFR